MAFNPINVENMSVEELKKFINSFDHLFSDCDGVVWTEKPLPGSGDFFRLMKSFGKSVHFVSNNSLRSKENYKQLFNACGINDGVENLTYPSIAISEYLKSHNFDKHSYCVTCTETVKMMESLGTKCKYGPDLAPEYHDFGQFLEDDPDIGAVVFDSDYKVNLPKLHKSLTYLKRPEVHFICGASDRYVPLPNKELCLSTGVFIDIVQKESKRDPILLGKPGKLFGEFAMKRAGVKDPSRVLFIGDMIEQDIGLGKACGFKTMLILTSNSYEEMITQNELSPDYYGRSLGDLVPQLSKLI